ncbi:hypothetical protein [Streptomyces sp. TRM49041]|uniref:hypothetical protein n=1 Tax=Streptomyces sp. TRM49041 TaxID=2603216 RepID=UPI0011ED2684|nr:hypothetical protein [Streptomyces sp. TRM49041]
MGGCSYDDADGRLRVGVLIDPTDHLCLDLPEAADELIEPAHSPRNATGASAFVHKGPRCQGDAMPSGCARRRRRCPAHAAVRRLPLSIAEPSEPGASFRTTA